MNHIFKRYILNYKNSSYFKSALCCITTDSKQLFTKNDYAGSNKNKSKRQLYFGVGASTLICLGLYKYYDIKKKIVFSESNPGQIGIFRKDLPIYTMDDIVGHNTVKDRIWVVYKEGVYDITDFISEHPGGDVIMMAAGSSIEPFWMLYGIHNTDQVLEILEKMRIGNMSKEETEHITRDMTDLYYNDPKRHSVLKVACAKPFNAEPPASLLVAKFNTPNDIFYVRNHLPVPVVDISSYELEVEIEGSLKKYSFTLDQLQKFEKHTISATVMCAGNRRSEMSVSKTVRGLNWNHGSIGNATWTGVRVRDVLLSVGVTDKHQFKHVQFEGLDFDVSGNPYGGSIAFNKAMDPKGDVLLAFEMNGKPLPRDHGFPVRVIAPGIVGARNVKWLSKIVLSNEESQSFWQQKDYKGFSPSVDVSNADYSKASSIQQLPVISAICTPNDGDTVDGKDRFVTVKGYAWSGNGQKILRVDLTSDGGETWQEAKIDEQNDAEAPYHWSWTLWSAKIPINPDASKVEIWSKAIDSSFNTQPESFKNIWNFRGVLNNAYHRIHIHIRGK